MKYTILQIPFPNNKKDEEIYCKYAFTSLDFLRRLGDDIHPEIYKTVYSGEINTKNFSNVTGVLEELFRIFNIEHPEDFRGHSLSVSDIVKLNDKYYFCDSYSWEEVEFKLI